MRTCSTGVFKRAHQSGRPCLLGYIDKCSAPCVGRISPEEHRQIAEDFCDFMAGNTTKFTRRVERQMRAASDAMEYELAARLRDDLGALHKALEKNAVVLADKTDADVFALADDELEAAVRSSSSGAAGSAASAAGWSRRRRDVPELMGHLLQQVYGDQAQDGPDQVPREVLVPIVPAESEALAIWLGTLRGHRVDLRVLSAATSGPHGHGSPQRRAVPRPSQGRPCRRPHRAQPGAPGAPGRARAARRTAAHRVLRRQPCPGHQRRRLDGRLRGRPAAESEYRRFVVRGDHAHTALDGTQTVDDTAAMHEVLTRRFQRYLDEREHSAEIDMGRPSRTTTACRWPTARSTR